ncbi:hypothetical protein RRG08_059410 [Elysia crispata]|uniref:Uncharacterized protein n=1 Tax=Elysia crispata TaxID=231223 RepID=A0AAE1D7L0_9GAST|nr:hypothetical protein RRG08_059410 [Elysia crispata]
MHASGLTDQPNQRQWCPSLSLTQPWKPLNCSSSEGDHCWYFLRALSPNELQRARATSHCIKSARELSSSVEKSPQVLPSRLGIYFSCHQTRCWNHIGYWQGVFFPRTSAALIGLSPPRDTHTQSTEKQFILHCWGNGSPLGSYPLKLQELKEELHIKRS